MKQTLAPNHKSRTIIIQGPVGCGKTTLATIIARNEGTWAHYNAQEFKNRLQFGGFTGGPDTVIVDNCHFNTELFEAMKTIVTSDTYRMELRGKEAAMMPTPHFIFISVSDTPIRFSEDERRFQLITLGK